MMNYQPAVWLSLPNRWLLPDVSLSSIAQPCHLIFIIIYCVRNTIFKSCFLLSGHFRSFLMAFSQPRSAFRGKSRSQEFFKKFDEHMALALNSASSSPLCSFQPNAWCITQFVELRLAESSLAILLQARQLDRSWASKHKSRQSLLFLTNSLSVVLPTFRIFPTPTRNYLMLILVFELNINSLIILIFYILFYILILFISLKITN